MHQRQGFGGIAVMLCLVCSGVWTQEAVLPPDAPLECILYPVEKGFSGYVRGADDPNTEIVFKKEPGYAGDKVYRNVIQLSEDRKAFIGLAFDVAAKTLYVDRNRNLDLTDDGPAIAAEEFWGSGSAQFSKVIIERTFSDIAVPYVLETYFFDGYSYSIMHSGWKGEIEIAGKRCEIGISDNLDGVFNYSDRFMFDHERNREARLAFGTVNELQLPRWVYFDGQSYRIAPEFRVLDGQTVLSVSLTPVTEDLMELSFEGQFVSRLILFNSAEKEQLLVDWPVAAMHIPQGTYTLYQVDLLDSFTGYSKSRGISVDGTETLKTGGPVKQVVQANRRGKYLALDYALEGADAIQYSPNRTYDNPARFEVYSGDRKVGAGQFEYG